MQPALVVCVYAEGAVGVVSLYMIGLLSALADSCRHEITKPGLRMRWYIGLCCQTQHEPADFHSRPMSHAVKLGTA